MKKTGIELIAQERTEQIEKHGYTLDGDIESNGGDQLAHAASILSYPFHYANDHQDTPDGWDADVFRLMRQKPIVERLAIAGALIAAEIDRLQSFG